MIHVLVVDDEPIARVGICQLLSGAPSVLVNSVDSAEEAFKRIAEEEPDVIFMDIQMPETNGIHASLRILKEHPNIKIIFITAYSEDPVIIDLLKHGASGCLSKGASSTEMFFAIQQALLGKQYFGHSIAKKLALTLHSGVQQTPFEVLSDREKQIALLLARGYTVPAIAKQLSVQPKTIHHYRPQIYKKLNVDNNVALAWLCIRYGIMDKPLSLKDMLFNDTE